MTAELGLAALWLAAAFAGLQAVSKRLAAAAAYAQVTLLIVAAAALVAVFVAVDLSVEVVIARADLGLPLGYRIAAAVGASPALLAATMLAVVGAVATLRDVAPALLVRFGVAGLVVDAVALSTAPFARAVPRPTAGNGLDVAEQVPALVAVLPLEVAAGVALFAALVPRSTAVYPRGAWAASALLAAATLVATRVGWETTGTLAVVPAAWAWAAVTLGAIVLTPRNWPVAIPAVLAVAASQIGFDRPVARVVGLAPVAGPNWSAVEATVVVGATEFRPQWRDYAVPPRARGQAAVAGGTAVAMLDASGARLRVERRPYLPMAWLAGIAVVLAASVAARRQ